MRDNVSVQELKAVAAMRGDLRDADDHKIERIAAMLDEVSDTPVKQAILDPLRPRLRSLKTIRPLRLERLLFTPFGPLVVPANHWKPGDAFVPRTVLTAMCKVVRAGLGGEVADIEKRVAGHKADAIQVITSAGQILWPRAAEILAASSAPSDWGMTGLRPDHYAPLAGAIAAVLRRAPQLRALFREGEVAAVDADYQAIDQILRGIASEPAEGSAMVTQLILLQSPHAIEVMRQVISASQNSAERAFLHQAVARATDNAITLMESRFGIVEETGHVPLSGIGEHVRRVGALLRGIASDAGAAVVRPRIKTIRDRLDQICRTRFADGVEKGIVLPLGARLGPVAGTVQSQMENCARDLRRFEAEIRKAGVSKGYQALLVRASDAVMAAAEAGDLTPVRKYRLIEILSGSEAATALYRKEMTAA